MKVTILKTAHLFSEMAEGPCNGASYWAETIDGIRLRIGSWRVPDPCKGTILLFPGRTEYVEIHGRTAKAFEHHGFSTVVVDWRGHGLSDRVIADPNTLHVNRFSDYQFDVDAVVETASELDMPKPWFLLGNSMGGSIGLRALLKGLPVSACAFTAPMWGLRMSRVQRMTARPVSWAAQFFGRGESYVPGHDGKNYALSNPFTGNRITNDPDHYSYWVRQARLQPGLQTAGSSMRWLHQSLLECMRLSKEPSPDVPCLAFCGDQDGLVDINVVRSRMNAWPEGRFEMISSAKHALLLETPKVRQRVISDIAEHFGEFCDG